MTRRIADNAPDMIWAKDMDNRYLFANRALVRPAAHVQEHGSSGR
jgi:PAS domain-containing protein